MAVNPIYKVVNAPIDQFIPNPTNPRRITDDSFERLVKSIKDAPWMLKLRPIVVNRDRVILGGNQRFKACLKAGMTHLWVIIADQISDEQQRKFILRDNIDFGKWDLEIIRRQYSDDELIRYGVQIELLNMEKPIAEDSIQPLPLLSDDAEELDIPKKDLEKSEKNFNDNSIKQIIFQYPIEIYQEALKDLDAISKELDCDDNSEVLLRLINFYEVANGLSDADNDSNEGRYREDEDGQTIM